jgi:hypothetical protein
VGAAFAHRWEPPFRGGTPPQRLTIGAVQKSQTTSAFVQLAKHGKFGNVFAIMQRITSIIAQ